MLFNDFIKRNIISQLYMWYIAIIYVIYNNYITNFKMSILTFNKTGFHYYTMWFKYCVVSYETLIWEVVPKPSSQLQGSWHKNHVKRLCLASSRLGNIHSFLPPFWESFAPSSNWLWKVIIIERIPLKSLPLCLIAVQPNYNCAWHYIYIKSIFSSFASISTPDSVHVSRLHRVRASALVKCGWGGKEGAWSRAWLQT